MQLNDVWNKANLQIGFYTTNNFHRVPNSPGVYAWFYPLRITTTDIEEFLNQVKVVLNYDSLSLGNPKYTTNLNFNWEKIELTAEVKDSIFPINTIKSSWDSLCKPPRDEKKFEEFRKIIMRSSILLPPLYVGKTTNLFNRCHQHINGNGSTNNFHNRFSNYTKDIPNVSAKKVSELLFVCIQTEEISGPAQDIERLIETILMLLAKPKYSKI